MADDLYSAWVLTGPQQLELQQRSLRSLQDRLPPTGALVRVHAAGVCHTDIHRWHGYISLGDSDKIDYEERGFGYPIVLGHEIAGRIHSLGSRVGSESGLAVGARVAVYPWIGCGECSHCRTGNTNLCSESQELGFVADGGYSEFVLVPHCRYLCNLPDAIPFEHAASFTCGALTAYSSIKKALPALEKAASNKLEPVVAIIGLGGLGQWALRLLPKCLAVSHKVIGVDVSEEKLKLVKESGLVTEVFYYNPSKSAEEQVQEFDKRPNAILDFVNSTATFTFALQSLSRSGCLVLSGLHGGLGELKLPLFALSDCTISGNYTGSLQDTVQLIELVSKHSIPPPPIATYPLQDANKALQDLCDGRVLGRAILKCAD